jgi:hypothetical protein
MQPAAAPLEPWRAESPWLAGSIGARVRRGGCGQVHSVFARAANLVGEHGNLTALLAADAPRVAHGLRLRRRCGDFARWFSPGAAFRWHGEDLCIASRDSGSVRISTGAAEVWRGQVERSARSAPEIVGTIAALKPPHPRPSPARGEGSNTPSPSTGEGWGEGGSRVLTPRLLALRDAYRADSTTAIAQAVHGLIGLGPGLTPAGDDALIGWLAGTALLGPDRRSEALCHAVRARLARTTDVSRAHLEDALAGEFSEPLAQLANALLRSAAEAQRALADLAAVGATSGRDAAAGLLAAVETATNG